MNNWLSCRGLCVKQMKDDLTEYMLWLAAIRLEQLLLFDNAVI